MWENITSSTRGDATWEIIIMLLVAFILGYILRWLISGKGKDNSAEIAEWKAKYERSHSKASGLERDLSDCRKKKLISAAAAPASAAVIDFKDDLTKVEGIGPKVQELLYKDGITSFTQLSKAEPTYIKSLLDKVGGIMAQRSPASWPQQAGLAAAGKWDELKRWQDEHDHGIV